ncbi:MAG TPA: LuxR C-terminal-related transcriptional regulator [Microbacteriaceae bacterium]|nr:LuxR C-terminal-related transcriptional regulator [Microbacteriaceae bacterium]
MAVLTQAADEWPLVAREAALSALDAVTRGDATVATIHGAPGTGKSRLAAEFALRAEAAGLGVVRSFGNPLLTAVPLGALLPDRIALDIGGGDPGALVPIVEARLLEFAGDRSVVAVVDDIQHLDPTSLGVLSRLVAAGRIRLVAVIASGEPLPDEVTALWTTTRFVRVELEPMTYDEVHELLEAVFGERVAPRSAVHLADVAAGHLLFLREITLDTLRRGTLARTDGGSWRLADHPGAPPLLRDLLRARHRRMTPPQRDVAERLAVCGEIPVRQLRVPGALEALEELEHAGIVAMSGRVDLLARIAHPLMAEAIADSVSSLRRLALLTEQAEIAEDSGSGGESRAVTWRLEAGLPIDPEHVRSAAALAYQSGDLLTARTLTQAALRTRDDPAILLLHGQVLSRMGRANEALAAFATAMRLADDLLAPALAAEIALARSTLLDGHSEALSEIDEAIRRFGLLPRLGLVRARILLREERAAEALACLDALEIADDEVLEAEASSARARALASLGRIDEALAAARAAVAVAESLGADAPPGVTIHETHLDLAEVLLQTLDLVPARESAMIALRGTFGADDEIFARAVELTLGRIAYFEGDLDAAERWFNDTRAGALLLGPEIFVPAATSGLSMVAACRGAFDDARRHLEWIRGADDRTNAPAIAPLWLAGCAGEPDRAVAGLAEEAQRLRGQGHETFATGVLGMLIELDRAEAAVPLSGRIAADSPSRYAALTADHALAVAEGDGTRLEELADEWERLGSRRFAATAFAAAARARRAAGDARGAAAAQARVEELAARCGGLMTPVLWFADELSPLTRREREIAALAAGGLSSKEIAVRLFLSSRTVDNHLQSVYGKLGIRGRAELAAAI